MARAIEIQEGQFKAVELEALLRLGVKIKIKKYSANATRTWKVMLQGMHVATIKRTSQKWSQKVKLRGEAPPPLVWCNLPADRQAWERTVTDALLRVWSGATPG